MKNHVAEFSPLDFDEAIDRLDSICYENKKLIIEDRELALMRAKAAKRFTVFFTKQESEGATTANGEHVRAACGGGASDQEHFATLALAYAITPDEISPLSAILMGTDGFPSLKGPNFKEAYAAALLEYFFCLEILKHRRVIDRILYDQGLGFFLQYKILPQLLERAGEIRKRLIDVPTSFGTEEVLGVVQSIISERMDLRRNRLLQAA